MCLYLFEVARYLSHLSYINMLQHTEDVLNVRPSVCLYAACFCYSNWEEWRVLHTKSHKQIVPRCVLEFTPLISVVTEDLMQHLRDSRGLDNSVNGVMAPPMDWSFEGVWVVLTVESVERVCRWC